MKRVVVFSISDNTGEIRSLLDTLGVAVVKEFVQNRAQPHKVGFLGPGKIDEVKEDLKDVDYDWIVINGNLRPSQHHYLEMEFQKECVDRPGIILRIFSDHAHTPEAIAQVTLAKLRYELPFLREWIHKAKKGDRPGFLAGGAYATDVYFEHAKSHARHIEQRLDELSTQREVTRTKRKDSGYTLVSLAGYTNAGKSALMNRMCGAEVEVDSRLFSTLSTTTRRIKGVRGNVLMSDTVGFIRDLPPDLVKAFNSTLEEIFYADLILLVFDVSEPESLIESKLRISMDILLPRVEGRSLIVVGNKTDLVKDGRLDETKKRISHTVSPYELVFVSALSGEGIDSLKERIGLVQGRTWTILVTLPLTNQVYSLLSRLRSIASVVSSVRGAHLEAEIQCRPADASKISGWLEGVSGKITMTKNSEPAGSEAPMEEKGPPSEETGPRA